MSRDLVNAHVDTIAQHKRDLGALQEQHDDLDEAKRSVEQDNCALLQERDQLKSDLEKAKQHALLEKYGYAVSVGKEN